MLKTGNSILVALSLVAMLLSLAPLFIILLRRSWQQEILNFLMALSLLSFIQQVFSIASFTPSQLNLIDAVFRLCEFAILLSLFRSVIQPPGIRQLILITMVIFLSVVITTYGLTGVQPYHRTIAILEAIILLSAATLVLIQLMRSGQVFLFQLPLFWIIAGTLCFYTIFFIIELIPQYNGTTAVTHWQDKKLMLSLIGIIRSAFFVAAAAVSSKEERAKSASNY